VPAHKAYDQPSTVTPVDGEVAVNGPDGVGLSMTPDAAHQTGERLRDAAAEARNQSPRNVAEEDDEV
jgi:hypothetical protein